MQKAALRDHAASAISPRLAGIADDHSADSEEDDGDENDGDEEGDEYQ
jgi:hypothetical protein